MSSAGALGLGTCTPWCCRWCGWASYHVGWSGPEGRAANAHPLLLWSAMQALAAEGINRLDLGDVNTEDAPGLARFKIGAGANVRPLGPTILLPPLTLPRLGRGR